LKSILHIVLDWLTDDENRELAGEIEAVNHRMLEKLVESSHFLAVFFYDEDECEEECDNILLALEEIDDEADAYGIDMVKVVDGDTAAAFGIMQTPSMVYFRRGTAIIYEGDLMDSIAILGWLTSNEVFELKDEIEQVNRKMLERLLDENDFVATYFFEEKETCPKCPEILEELERIDQEADNLDIIFVRIDDTKYAKKWGVTKIPALVYFRRKFPSIYRGDLTDELAVLEWLQKNRYKQPELNLFMFALASICLCFVVYTVFILLFLKVSI
jgi:thiol-disulfide isomerase/thioredoxin